MSVLTSSASTNALSLVASLDAESRASLPGIDEEVLGLFDQYGPRLLRYVASFRLGLEESEDVLQDAFLSLFRHLHGGRSRTNLRAWLFQVAHNLALKRRRGTRVQQMRTAGDETMAAAQIDPGANPEERLAQTERRRRLCSVFQALPERDRRCLCLRAEGLRYREIAEVLGISLGGVAKSLSRSFTRLTSADEV
jgi:RNA polymerase sigma-70 factor (ECF subfamily)